MKRFVLPVVLAVVASVIACSAKTKNPELRRLRRRAAAIPILTPEEIGDREYEILAEVYGLSCTDRPYKESDMDGARQGMRIDAAEKNADAIANSFCEAGASLSPDCTSRIECRGDAIHWTIHVEPPQGLNRRLIPPAYRWAGATSSGRCSTYSSPPSDRAACRSGGRGSSPGCLGALNGRLPSSASPRSA